MICRILLVAIVSLSIACKDNATAALKAKEDSLFKAVMKGHDVGMARMSKISRAQSKVKFALDSLLKLPEDKLDEGYQQSLIDLQEDLNYAEFGMNTWMEEFKLDSAKNNLGLRVKYLESERDKVTKVRDNILNGLARADSLFKK